MIIRTGHQRPKYFYLANKFSNVSNMLIMINEVITRA